MKNLCDGGHATNAQVRKLPTGGDGQALLCFHCYVKEMIYRQELNAEQGTAAFELPLWKDLKIAKQGE